MFDEPKDRIEIAKLLDKIKYCKEKNKIVNTEFLDSYMQERLIKKLNELGYKNYLLFLLDENQSRNYLSKLFLVFQAKQKTFQPPQAFQMKL